MPESTRDYLGEALSQAQQYAYQSQGHYQLSQVLETLAMAVVLEKDKEVQSWCLAVQEATNTLRKEIKGE